MSDTVGTLDAADWSGTEELTIDDARKHDDVSTGNASVYRYLNGLDVSATITFDVTHGADADYSDAEQTATTTVSAGGSDGETLTEPWGRVRVSVTPASNPSTGSLRVIKEGP